MVRFIFGEAGSGKTEYIMSEVERVLDGSDMRAVILVPEQHTVATESRVLQRFGNASGLRLEVTNFTRLSDAVSRIVGKISYTHLSGGARRLVIHRAIMSVWQSLGDLSGVGGDAPRLVPLVYSALREITSAGISPEELARAAEELSAEGAATDARLASRLADLSLVMSAERELMQTEFGGVSDPVERLAETARESDFFRNTAVFIDSFYSLTGAELAAVGEIIRLSPEVNITFPMRSRHDDGIHLAAVRRYYETVLAAAVRFGGGVEFRELAGNRRAATRELAAISADLWNYSVSAPCEESDKPSVPDSVRVISVSDRYEEAEAAAACVASLVRSGARYSDIAVVCADVNALRGITDSAFRRHGIPCFVSEPSPLASTPATRLILSLLRIPGHWRGEDVVAAVKTGLMPVSDEDACSFESYCGIWNIRGRNMFETEWSMNPDGYRTELTERGRRTLAAVARARSAVVPPIAEFADVFRNAEATVRDICTAVVRFAEKTDMCAAMARRAEVREALSLGGDDDVSRERLVWSELCCVFDTMVEITGDAVVDAAGFATLFRYAISDAGVGAIPTGVDETVLAGGVGLRTDGVAHVIVLGAVAGEFPAVPSEDGCFSDADRERLGELGLPICGGSAERASEELFRFARTVSQAEESVTVFTPKTSGGAACRPSEGALRILELTGQAAPVEWRSLSADMRIFDRVSLESECRLGSSAAAQLRGLSAEMFGESAPAPAEPETQRISDGLSDKVFGKELHLTQSRIDTFVRCPFSYYCKYVLGLSEDRTAEISSPDIGTFVHAVLEEFFLAVSGRDLPIPEEEVESICDVIVSDYVRRTCGDAPDGRMAYLFRRLRRQVLVFVSAVMDEMAQSRFEAYRMELPVGMPDDGGKATPPPVEFLLPDGGRVSLHGIIDRMDVYRRGDEVFLRVVDYKTGSRTFSYDDIRHGLGVQLLLYLFSTWRSGGSEFGRELSAGGELRPAGALYLSLKPGDATSDGPLDAASARDLMVSRIDRSGIVTDEHDVLDAMDRGITGKYVPVSLKADGTLRRCASLATLERFGDLEGELKSVICRIAEEMRGGCAEARPLKRHGVDPCEYCGMKCICRH